MQKKTRLSRESPATISVLGKSDKRKQRLQELHHNLVNPLDNLKANLREEVEIRCDFARELGPVFLSDVTHYNANKRVDKYCSEDSGDVPDNPVAGSAKLCHSGSVVLLIHENFPPWVCCIADIYKMNTRS